MRPGRKWPGGAIRRFLAAATVLAAVSSHDLPARAAGGPELSIGFIGTLSGSGSDVAQDQIDGFKLGIKHLGGRIGGSEFSLTVIDDRGDATTARRAAQQLLAPPRAQVILLSSKSPVSAVLAPMAAAAHSFLIALDSPEPQLAGKGCVPNFFSLAPLSETLDAMAGLYLQNQGDKSVVLVAPENGRARQAALDFARGFRGAVTTVSAPRGAMEYRKEIARIHEIAPDAVYLLIRGGMAVNFIIQYRQSSFKELPRLVAPAGTSDQTVIAAAGEAAAHLFSVAPWSDDYDTPSNRRMMADFEVEYGRPPSIYAAYGYDAAMLLDHAVATVDRRLGDEDGLRNALRHADFPATQPGFRFDTDQFPIETYVIREVVEDAVHGRLSNEQRGVLARDVKNGHAGECPMRWPAEYAPPPRG